MTNFTGESRKLCVFEKLVSKKIISLLRDTTESNNHPRDVLLCFAIKCGLAEL